MEQFIFILGRDPELSKLELFTYFDARKVEYKVVEASDIAIILELVSINSKKVIKDLGGIQKIGRIITSFDGLYNGKDNKIRYGMSRYTEDEEDLFQDLKKYFKELKVKALLKKSHHHKQLYLDPSEAQGVVEIIQYKGIIAKTLAVFNPNEFKKRDTKIPVPRKSHQLSIRLTKILINISGARDNDHVLDPFCGSGIILQEAMLLGMHTIGLETDEDYLSASQKNLTWVKKQYNPKGSFKLINQHRKKVATVVPSSDFIITKPYMGPELKYYPRESEARKTVTKLRPQYSNFLKEFKKVVKKRLVFVSPRYKTKSKKEYVLLRPAFVERHGFNIVKNIVYSSSGSRMDLDIWVVEPQN
jgi:tRNA G10  N-methylase Trm11